MIGFAFYPQPFDIAFMSDIIFFNNEFLVSNKISIPINDRGLLLGDGLFETLRFENGDAFMFSAHWSRLIKGCEILNIPLVIQEKEAEIQCKALLEKNQLLNKAASVRITLTRGSGSRGLIPPPQPTPNLIMQCAVLPEKSETPIKVMLSNVVINERSPLRQFKSLNYAEHIIARMRAIEAGFDDALLTNTKGQVVSTTCANVFFDFGDEVITPPLSAGALPGIMRQHLIETATTQGIKIIEKNLYPEDCKQAHSVFATNSLIQKSSITLAL